ncbi:MAG: ABC transporter permease [Acidobacteria bacterium]|nr:ABC transporter permease [Acidobacteriota bacterium]
MPLGSGVVISHRVWKSEFNGSSSAVGSPVRIDGADFRIAGVAPERLDGLYSDQSIDLWVPAAKEDTDGDGRRRRDLWVVARLRDRVSAEQAQKAILSGAASSAELIVVPFTGLPPSMARGLSRVGLFLTMSAASVFLVACLNVASFLLGRALRRSHETCLRIALGATREELLRDMFADSLVIALGGGCLGVLLGVLTARALPVFLFEGDAQRLAFAPHLLPIGVASLLCVVLTVICGMLPVVGTVTDRPWMVLQRETGSPSRAVLRLRSALVVGQITVCCTLVVCSAVLINGLHSALKTGAGQQLGGPVLLTVQAQPFQGPEIDAGYFESVEKKVRSIAGLTPLTWTQRLPGNQPAWQTFRIQQLSAQYREVAMDISWLTPESIEGLERLPVAGRMFGIGDQGRRVAVLNEEAAAELFGKQTVGMIIRDSADLPVEIIGVVQKAGTKGPREQGKSKDTEEGTRPTIYYGYLNQAEAPSTMRDARFHVPLAVPVPNVELNANVVSANYFNALGTSLVAGRKFGADRVATERRVAVINQEAADFYFNGRPLGAGVIDESGVRTEVVGVVRSQSFGTFEQHVEPTIYFPMWQDCPPRMTLMLKASRWNKAISSDLRQKVEAVPGRSLAASTVSTLDAQLEHSGLAALRIATLIGGASAAMALLLGLLGLMNAQGDAERQRQRDRALRIALGAQRWRIVLLVVKAAGRLALIGSAAGGLLSLSAVRFLVADVAMVASPSLDVWLLASLLPMAAVLIVSLVPAGRASVIAPAVIMRDM